LAKRRKPELTLEAISRNPELVGVHSGLRKVLRTVETLSQLATEFYIRVLEREYTDTGSPLYVWMAWNRAREASLPIPDWVASYLDAAAEKLLAIDPKISLLDRRKEVENALALGGRPGKASGISRFHRFERDFDLANEIQDLIEEGRSLNAAAAQAAKKYGLQPETAKRKYRALRRLVGASLAEL
jgi:hypothetical protein